MALSSSTIALSRESAKADATKVSLLSRHRKAVDEVVSDAKSFSDDRKRELGKIVDKALRQSAAR
jgi:hypothetical protein